MLFVLLLAFHSVHAEKLMLLNWEDYLHEEVMSQWERQADAEIEPIYFDNDEKRDEILLNSQFHHVDIAVVDEVVGARFGEQGVLIPIDESLVPNIKYVDKFWRERCGAYSVPYLWGTLGIMYRTDKVKNPPNSWRDILEPAEELKGHVGMLNDHTDMLAPALFSLGFDLNTDDSNKLRQAFELLKRQAEHVLTYEYPITFLQKSDQAQELYMGVSYGGDQRTLNDIAGERGLWAYSVPREGTVLWVDCLAVTANSSNIEKSLDFINHMTSPEISAKNSEYLKYATPSKAAAALTSPKFRGDKQVFPEVERLNNSKLYEQLSDDNIVQRLRITNAIINTHEAINSR